MSLGRPVLVPVAETRQADKSPVTPVKRRRPGLRIVNVMDGRSLWVSRSVRSRHRTGPRKILPGDWIRSHACVAFERVCWGSVQRDLSRRRGLAMLKLQLDHLAGRPRDGVRQCMSCARATRSGVWRGRRRAGTSNARFAPRRPALR